MGTEIFTALIALAFVLALLGGLSWVVKRFGLLPGHSPNKNGKSTIQTIDSRIIDAKNRIIAVKWHDHEYLLGAGANGITVIDKRNTGNEHGENHEGANHEQE